MIDPAFDPFKELEDARADMVKLNENAEELPIKEWMDKWRVIRSRIARAAFAIEQQARDLA